MDTDAEMELDTLQVMARSAPPQGPAKELTALDLVNHLTKNMANATAEVIDRLARPLLVTNATDAALRERFMQRRAAAQHFQHQSSSNRSSICFRQVGIQAAIPPEGGFLAIPSGDDTVEDGGTGALAREKSRTW